MRRSAYALIGATTVSRLGSIVFAVVASYSIAETAGLQAAGWTVGFASLVGVLVGLLAMGWIDLWPRRRVLLFADAVAAGVNFVGVALMSIGAGDDKAPVLIGGAALLVSSVAASVYAPASRALVAHELGSSEAQAVRYNSVYTAAAELVKSVGPWAAGLVILLESNAFAVALLLNGLSFTASWLLTFAVPEVQPTAAPAQSYLRRLTDGVVALRASRFWSRSVLLNAVLNLLLPAMTYALLARVAEGTLQDAWFGYSLGAEALGALVFAALASKVRAPNYVLISGAGAALIAVGAVSPAWALVVCFVHGACISVYNVRFFAGLQLWVPAESAGRVFALVLLLSQSALPVGNAVWGSVAGVSSAWVTSAISGAAIVLVAMFLVLSTHGQNRPTRSLQPVNADR